ncbi:MAG: hypothetical protein JXR97_04625 [Planctomycetes bacterium]|nr:hypothetical protein [Planctomycetota bacterium]
MPDSRTAKPNRLSWHGFSFDLPPEWEVTGYNCNPVEGQIDIHTRNGYQGQVHWRLCKTRPDEVRIMSEVYRRSVEEEDKEAAKALPPLTTERLGRFTIAYGENGRPCQASLYLDESKMLIQWLFPKLDKATLQSLWKPLLSTFRRNDEEMREWAMFGVVARLPKEFTLVEFSPQPANILFTWAAKKHLQITIRRWGLPEVLLDGRDMETFYKELLRSSGCQINQTTSTLFHKHKAVEIEFEKRGQVGMDKLSGKWWIGKAVLWLNEEEMRLYSFEQVGHKKVPRLEVDNVITA